MLQALNHKKLQIPVCRVCTGSAISFIRHCKEITGGGAHDLAKQVAQSALKSAQNECQPVVTRLRFIFDHASKAFNLKALFQVHSRFQPCVYLPLKCYYMVISSYV